MKWMIKNKIDFYFFIIMPRLFLVNPPHIKRKEKQKLQPILENEIFENICLLKKMKNIRLKHLLFRKK